MSTLTYVGKSPDSDSSVVHKLYVDTQYAAIKVDNAYVDTQIAVNAANMVTPGYVDAQDALRAHKTAVDTADATYVPTSQQGVASGVASIGSDGFIPSGQVPTVVTDRIPVIVNGTITLSGSHTVTTTSVKEFQIGTMTITDPGYVYQPLVFVNIQGASSGATAPASGSLGTGSYGRITVLGPGDTIYAQGITTANYRTNHFQAFPYAALNAVSSTLSGSLTLDLWISLWSGTTYTFSSTNMAYYALVLPAI